jgi:hypothetical protein
MRKQRQIEKLEKLSSIVTTASASVLLGRVEKPLPFTA